MSSNMCAYQVDDKWRITSANEEFCRALRCTPGSLIGRDVRDLIRRDWQIDFRGYVARALVGVGDDTVTLPMVAPCSEVSWFTHTLEPIMGDGHIKGYRATMVPHSTRTAPRSTAWFTWRGGEARNGWDFEPSAVKAS